MSGGDPDTRDIEWAVATGRPFLTEHAIEQWDNRTPEWSVAPETALEAAPRLPELATSPHFADDGFDAFYPYLGTSVEGWYAALFCEENDVIRTVLVARDMYDPRLAAMTLLCALAERGDES